MKRKIQVRRGLAADRPTLASGEFGLDTDTGSEALYIGTPAGNKQIARSTAVPSYVDIPIYIQISGNFGAQSTNYSGLGSSVALSSAENSLPYSAFGITGTVVGMYLQCKTNTMAQNTVISLESGVANATDLTTSNVAITLGAGIKNASVTDQTLSITPTMIGGLKFVSASGSGTMTLIAITLIVRCSLA